MPVWKPALIVFAGAIALIVWVRPDRALQVATGLVAHELCTKTFLSGFEPESVFAETLARPGIKRLKLAMRYQLDRSDHTARVSLLGLFASRATFRQGYGCSVLNATADPHVFKTDLTELKARTASQSIVADGPIVSPGKRMRDVLDQAFAEPERPPNRNTKAFVVLKDGKLIAEKYAPGVTVETPLSGFSMTKSVVNALLGILSRQGRLFVDQPAPIAEWQGAGDPRRAITVEQLVRMTSGLALDENSFGFDPASQMLYLKSDMYQFAAAAQLVATPGTRWAYSSPSTHLLAGIIRNILGGQPEQTLEFAWRELFGPLGMRNVTLEFDSAGTLIGSVFMSASARDWARFGSLYLHDGMVGERRILPEGWVSFSAAPTLDTDYGAGFWTNRSNNEHARSRVNSGMPQDAFFAFASLGQTIMIIPSQDLVVVRLGDAVDEREELIRIAGLIRDVISAAQAEDR